MTCDYKGHQKTFSHSRAQQTKSRIKGKLPRGSQLEVQQTRKWLNHGEVECTPGQGLMAGISAPHLDWGGRDGGAWGDSTVLM